MPVAGHRDHDRRSTSKQLTATGLAPWGVWQLISRIPRSRYQGVAADRTREPGQQGLALSDSQTMASAAYADFRDSLFGRHENPITSALSILADVIILASLPAGAAKRDTKVSLGIFLLGFLVAVAAHFFQSGSVKDEAIGLGRHPLWSVRAETERVYSVLRPRPA